MNLPAKRPDGAGIDSFHRLTIIATRPMVTSRPGFASMLPSVMEGNALFASGASCVCPPAQHGSRLAVLIKHLGNVLLVDGQRPSC